MPWQGLSECVVCTRLRVEREGCEEELYRPRSSGSEDAFYRTIRVQYGTSTGEAPDQRL